MVSILHHCLIYGIHYTASLAKVQTLIDKGLITRENVTKLAKEIYVPQLKAISYSLNDNHDEIAIFSHAPIGLNTIQELAKKFDVEFKDDSIENLAITIDSINQHFQEHARKNEINTLYSRNNIYNFSRGSYVEGAPIEAITWNRNLNKITRPAAHHNYKLKFIHGHDPKSPQKEHIDNLDNGLGKGICDCKGEYSVHYSSQDPIQLSQKRINYEKAQEDLKSICKLFDFEEWNSDVRESLRKIEVTFSNAKEIVDNGLDEQRLGNILKSLKNQQESLDISQEIYSTLQTLIAQIEDLENKLSSRAKCDKIIDFYKNNNEQFKKDIEEYKNQKKDKLKEIVRDLLNLTNDCLKVIGKKKPAYSVMNQLKNKLEDNHVSSENKIKNFYDFLSENEGHRAKVIREDNSKSTKKFIAGILAIAAIIITLPVGLLALGVVNAVAKIHAVVNKKEFNAKLPHHLLKPHKKGETFITQVENNKQSYLNPMGFFKKPNSDNEKEQEFNKESIKKNDF